MEIIRQRFRVPSSVAIKIYAPEFLSRGEAKRTREGGRGNKKGVSIRKTRWKKQESDREQNSAEFARLRVVAGSGSRVVCRRM